jgi:hypothetical protein
MQRTRGKEVAATAESQAQGQRWRISEQANRVRWRKESDTLELLC